MKKTISKNNRGYSLIELVIVIAIVAILATMALVSVTIIHSARAKDAALQFDSMISECISMNKNMKPNVKVDPTDPNSDLYDGFAIAVYKRNATSTRPEQFIIAPVYYYEAGGISGSGHYSPIYNVDNIDSNPCKERILQVSKSVSMTFKGTTYYNASPEIHNLGYSTATAPKSGGHEWVYIRFDKKGNCISGYGEYVFYKKNGNQVSRVTLNQNGSHEVK